MQQLSIGLVFIYSSITALAVIGFFVRDVATKKLIIYTLLIAFFLVAFISYGPTFRAAATRASDQGIWSEQFAAGMLHIISSITFIRVTEILLVAATSVVLISINKGNRK